MTPRIHVCIKICITDILLELLYFNGLRYGRERCISHADHAWSLIWSIIFGDSFISVFKSESSNQLVFFCYLMQTSHSVYQSQ